MYEHVISELAPNGVLRAGINMSNPLLVTGSTPSGDPVGVSPDLAQAIAERLGVELAYIPFASPGILADAAVKNEWDIGLIAAEPARAETIAFTPAYVEIEATYLVPQSSTFDSVESVDSKDVRVAVSDRSAYDLYLTRTLRHAQLFRAKGLSGAVDLFVNDKMDALAGLRPALNEDAAKLTDVRILDGRYTTVQQAVGTKLTNTNAAEFLIEFVSEAIKSGLVGELIDRHGVTGRLLVASQI